MNWFVYILRCRDGTLYTGITTDLIRRVHEHNSPSSGAKYTRSRRPVELLYWEEFACRKGASKREYEIKKMKRLKKLHLIYP